MLDAVENELQEIISGEFSTAFILNYKNIDYDFNCIFDKTYLEIDNDGAPIMSRAPQIGVAIDLIYSTIGETINIDEKPTVTHNNKTYYIKSIEDDGAGFARILLKN